MAKKICNWRSRIPCHLHIGCHRVRNQAACLFKALRGIQVKGHMIRKVTVLGAGTMGAQIAGHAANAGLSVLLLDVSAEQVRMGLQALEKSSPAALFVPDKIRQIEKGS